MSFITIANESSIRRAAEKLNISASALSRQMRILEDDFGTQLMIRLPRGIELTDAGQTLLKKATIWLREESHLRFDLQRSSKERLTVLRLGIMECLSHTLPTLLEQRLDPILGEYRLDIKVGNTQSLLAQLESKELDIIVAFNVQENKTIRIFSQVTCPIGLIYPIDLKIDAQKSIALADCLKWPLCLADDELSFQPRIYAEIMKQKKAHTLSASSNSVNVLKQWVLAGRGVTFLTEFDVARELANKELLFKPLKERRLSEQLCLCTVDNTQAEPKVRAILRELEDALEPIENKSSPF